MKAIVTAPSSVGARYVLAEVPEPGVTRLLARFLGFLSLTPSRRVTFDTLVPERTNGYGLGAKAVRDILSRKPALVITLLRTTDSLPRNTTNMWSPGSSATGVDSSVAVIAWPSISTAR